MIVDDADMGGVSFHHQRVAAFGGFCCVPAKTNPPLAIDADTKEPDSIPLEGLKAVARQGPKVGQGIRIIQNAQAALGLRQEGLILPHPFPGPNSCRQPIMEAADHGS